MSGQLYIFMLFFSTHAIIAFMKTSTLVWVVIILIIIIGGWYIWMQSNVPAPANNATATSRASTSANSIQNNLTLGTDSTSTIGTYLVAYNGMTLYTYAKDSNGTSTCYAQCAVAWPPYTVPQGMAPN